MREPATLDARYYEELGILKDGKFQPTAHVEQLTEALGGMPSPRGGSRDALEVGPGVSPYARTLVALGWHYFTVEPSRWAVDFMMRVVGPHLGWSGLDRVAETTMFGFILAAHVFEHLEDAPGAIAKCSRLLEPGGEFWVIVPDDGDPVNPDHLWVFRPETLRSCLESAGLIVDRMAVRKYVAHENFIYARTRKPI